MTVGLKLELYWPITLNYLSSWGITFLVRKSLQFIKLQTRSLFCEQRDLRVLRDISVLAGELNCFHSEDIFSERSRTQFLRSTQSHPLKTTIKPLPNVLIFLMSQKFVSYMIITSTLRPIQPHDLSFPLMKNGQNGCYFLGDAKFEKWAKWLLLSGRCQI